MQICVSSYLLSKLKPTGIWSASPPCIRYHRNTVSQLSLLQSSSMTISSRQPTGLPRTPGNPDRPWRGWKTEEGGRQKGGEGGGWGTVFVKRWQTTQKRKWTETGVSHTGEKVYCKSHEASVQGGKTPSALCLQPTQPLISADQA